MIEYHLALRSFNETAQRASAVADERGTTMHELLNQGLWADREREVAWVDRHGWQDAERRWKRRRQRREAVARALRALAARFAPMDGEAVGERGQMVVERRA